MSGSTIGGFVGGAIGFYFGGPTGAQWGFMIGSAAGGYVDPQKIEGPRLTDAQTQTSNEGVPRPIIYGKAAVGGNLIQWGPLVEHKHSERAGKGGPVQTTYTYTRTVAIRICEAAPLGGTMRLVRVWKDDKLVADWSPANTIPADTAAFASMLTFYSGAEDQLPDPSLEALPEEYGGGVGNVPSYRGTCYAVLTDLDCTDRQGAVPQFRWEVASDATEDSIVTSTYAAPRYSRFTNGLYPLADDAADYTILSAGGYNYDVTTSSIEAGIAQAAADSRAYPAWGGPTQYLGSLKGGPGPFAQSAGAMEGHGATTDFTNYRQLFLLYSWVAPTAYQNGVKINQGSTPVPTSGAWTGDALGIVFRSYSAHDSTLTQFFPSSTPFEGFRPHYVQLQTKQLAPIDAPQFGEFELPDAPGYVSDRAGNVRKLGGTATSVAGSFRTLALEQTAGATYIQREIGPVLPVGDPNDNQAFWEAAYAEAVAAGTIASGKTYQPGGDSTHYPRNRSGAYLVSSSARISITPGMVSLAAIVADLCARGDIASDQVDVSALTEIVVRGYPIGRQTSPAEAIKPLQDVFDFDMPEWGNSGDDTTKLRAVLRGGAIKATITDDDLVDNDEDDDGTRAQQVEFPRKVTLTFADPEANYEPASQPAERTTENVRAVGETQISTNVVLTRSEAAVIVDKLLKRLWEEANGRISRELPEEFSQYTPSDPVSYLGKRWRIEKAERADGTNRWDMVRDRASNANSTATGSPAAAPTAPVSSMRGPTMFAAMNLPRLRSQDTTPGMCVAVCGVLPGWAGCDLYLSVDGGVTEQKVATILEPATMGTLSASLAADGTTLSVSLYDGQLDSASAEQLAARQNAAAVTTAGVSELLQFATATEIADDAYDLTALVRPLLGTAAAAHYAGDSFVLLDGAGFALLPLDIALAGKTLIFRPVSIGTAPANNPTYSVVYQPRFYGPQLATPLTTNTGDIVRTNTGEALQVIT